MGSHVLEVLTSEDLMVIRITPIKELKIIVNQVVNCFLQWDTLIIFT